MFLAPPLRRPYELYYFCNFVDNITIVIDKETFSKYSDSFDEFKPFNYQYIFLSIERRRIGKLFNFDSTAALINYNEEQLSKIIRDKKITTVISVEIFSTLSVQAARLSSKFSLKHIVIVWENINKSPFYIIPPFSINTKIVKSTASKFIAVSNMSKQSIISLHINEDKIETIYPGIFIDNFEQSTDSANKILFVGNLVPHRGVDLLIQAFKKLSNYFFDVKLILVGKGSLEPEIIKLINSGLKIEYSKEYIPRSKLIAVYSGCSIFCSPSVKFKKAGLILTWQEQFGFALVEAMAAGLPIVASNVGVMPEIVGPENLVVSPNIDNIFAALYKLLTCDELRKELRCKNRERSISRFNALTQSRLFEKAVST